MLLPLFRPVWASAVAALFIKAGQRCRAALGRVRLFNLNDAKWGRGSGDDPPEPPKTPQAHAPADESPAPQGEHEGVPPPSSPPSSSSTTPAPLDRVRASPGQGGGSHGEQQPPDLDEVWKQFNAWLGRLLGRTGQGRDAARGAPPGHSDGPTDTPPPAMGGARRSAGMIAGAVLVLWLATGFYLVQEGHQAVILRFGEFLGPQAGIKGAGVNWRWPYPIEEHRVVAVSELRKIEIGKGTRMRLGGRASTTPALTDSSMLTQDENIVDVKFVVQYRLGNPADFLFNNQRTEKAVELAAETAVREVVGKSSMNTVLNEKREAIAGDVMKSIQMQLDLYRAGIVIASVNIQNVQPPEQVQSAFDDALKAGQDGDRAKNEGQAYANDIIPRAEGAASRLREEAQGYRARVMAQAEGDAARFKSILPEYQRAPQVMRDRLYVDTMQQIYSNTTKVLIDTKANSQLLYLPLDKLLQTGAISESPPAAVPAPGSGSSAAGAAPVTDGRTRDDGRTREVR